MRPVLLEMNGFASFREPTVVDFRGAEYFALVGPTGAGKSTVIDALTFALYGSVPRWDDRRAVALALAPTVGRGAVRLVFDVGGARFVVVRELRRAASGGVSVRSARLERLRAPDGIGGVDEEVDPLADGAGTVTKAVEELLGLPFGDFCTCVVLPQGDFAEFLHTEPRKRQEKLVRILGLGVYDQIARDANTEAAAARQRVEVLAQQLTAYADATAEAERAADARVDELAALRDRVALAVPRLTTASAAVDQTSTQLGRVRAERAQLAALAVPDGLTDLDARRRASIAALDVATARADAAEVADTEARATLADAPARGPLELLRRRHAELAVLTAELPGARDHHIKAVAADATAARDATEARAAVDTARAAAGAADAVRTAAIDAEHRFRAERDALRAVTLPDGLDALDRDRARAAAALDAAVAALDAAEVTDTRARDAVAGAPARGPLEQARRDHRDLAGARAERRVAVGRRDAADADLAGRVAESEQVRHRLAHARDRRSEIERTDLAALLRPTLVAGAACPVCAQDVAVLPAALPGSGDGAGADRAVAEAEAAYERARTAESAATGVAVRASAEVERCDATIARLRSSLAALRLPGADPAATPGSADADVVAGPAAAVDAALAALDLLVTHAATAGDAVRAARRRREAAASAVDAVREGAASATAALRAARDPLVPLGAPAIDPVRPGDLRAGWVALVGWAHGQAAARDGELRAAQVATAAAAAERDRAAVALRAAEAADRDRRREETAAARSEQEARGIVADLARRAAELVSALAGAPTDAAAAAALDRRGELEHAAAVANVEVSTARAGLRAAERAVGELGREVAAAWDALRAARDPLVGLEAPAVVGDDLLAAWTALVTWAQREAEIRARRAVDAHDAHQRARSTRDDLERQLTDDLRAHGVEVGSGPAPGSRAPGSSPAPSSRSPGLSPATSSEPAASGALSSEPASSEGAASAGAGASAGAAAAVATALERARGARERIVERRAAAAAITADRDEAESAQQVAKLLGGLLRSDGFPRWLVASALDALVLDASRSLAELSGGQFELTHSGGEFLVIDHADADARRPVKTLSGGETFQASLALALALSAQMSGLAARGAARLESIFLDEGFGTLDEANLEVVAGTLENLATRGDRMVGVITHVPALAERVPVRFAVSRDQRTSSVVRESA